MHAADLHRATAAAASVVAALGLAVDHTVVLHDSNRLTVRLVPCDVLARVAYAGDRAAPFEVQLAQRLADAGGPVAALDPRVEPRVHEADGFDITLWTYEPPSPNGVSAADYAHALERLHHALRMLELEAPHYADRVAEALEVVEQPDRSPALADADRELLSGTLHRLRRAIDDRGAIEQRLHGEPHPGNVLSTSKGPLFVDLETCCRGPIEFDLAHVPEKVSVRYPNVDGELLEACRGLVLAMVAAWRWDREDQLPNGKRAAHILVDAVRQGPPWPTLDTVMPPT